MTTVGAVLRDATARLVAAGIDTARLDARLLVGHALGISAQQVFMYPERPLNPAEAAAVEAVIARRERREPVSHITGQREFWSLSFEVTPDTLDPRADTETLVAAVLDALTDREAPLSMLDLGTGTGCILLSLLSECPKARGLGVDVQPGAVALASRNAQRLSMGDRASFKLGDWGMGLDGCFDVIVSNPPYIPDNDVAGLAPEVSRYEPGSALAGGADGLDAYRSLAPQIGRLLSPGGIVGLEVGQGQAEAVSALMGAEGFGHVWTATDLGGIARCVLARRS